MAENKPEPLAAYPDGLALTAGWDQAGGLGPQHGVPRGRRWGNPQRLSPPEGPRPETEPAAGNRSRQEAGESLGLLQLRRAWLRKAEDPRGRLQSWAMPLRPRQIPQRFLGSFAGFAPISNGSGPRSMAGAPMQQSRPKAADHNECWAINLFDSHPFNSGAESGVRTQSISTVLREPLRQRDALCSHD